MKSSEKIPKRFSSQIKAEKETTNIFEYKNHFNSGILVNKKVQFKSKTKFSTLVV